MMSVFQSLVTTYVSKRIKKTSTYDSDLDFWFSDGDIQVMRQW